MFDDKEYKKQWRKDHPDYDRQLKLKHRERLLGLLGGQCVNCGSTSNLEVDHIDPYTKTARPHDIQRWRDPTSHPDFLNLQLLCKSCHVLKSAVDGSYVKRGRLTQY